ncbi:RNA polymerase sigma factor [Nesterenkonia halotolerans]|uniref:RNA polymerase sigma-70 factor (ECF subfamily) n=1 Tax=Nesterenkonia halotolerans TaxID=225325 RepID=A0ABR9JAL4_9MICC|nr:RNA polymerase sigma factor [Nesterenkonia halotolerans]MBE1515606.1 RNA polymerase sigma-70 factor (ECF subfamily) [Nesterenkonia halotolerans]
MTNSQSSPLEAALKANGVDLLHYFQRRVVSEAAADLLAETMLTAWQREKDHPTDAEAGRRWLFGIASNVLRNDVRSRRRRYRLANKLRTMLGTPADSQGADDGVEVRDAVQRLDPEPRELIRLVHWEGFSIIDAGQILGISASTARGRYQRAKEQLREALEPDDSPTQGRCSATLPQVDPRFLPIDGDPR